MGAPATTPNLIATCADSQRDIAAEAFGELCDRFYDPVSVYVGLNTSSQHDYKEIMTETFQTVRRLFNDVPDARMFLCWVLRIARRVMSRHKLIPYSIRPDPPIERSPQVALILAKRNDPALTELEDQETLVLYTLGLNVVQIWYVTEC